jgi:hypothetical protein
MAGATILLQSKSARVVYRPYKKGDRYSSLYYGCSFARGKWIALGYYNPRTLFDHPKLSGTVLAYAIKYFGASGTRYRVLSRSLTNGKVIASSGGAAFGEVTALVLGRRGWVAWATRNDDKTVAIVKKGSAGLATLDEGTGIVAGSLAVSESGKIVYWIKDSLPRHAVLG